MKQKNISLLFSNVIAALFILLIGFMTTSCNSTYFPRLTSIPLIKEKGDTRIEGGATIIVPSIQASVSHGITDKIAIQVAGSVVPYVYYNSVGISDNSVGVSDNYLHGAVGYYKKINERNVVELYGGFAYGHGDYNGRVTGNYQDGNYQMYFTQFNFGNIKKKPDNMELGLGLKLGYLHTNMNISIDDLFHGFQHQKGVVLEPTGFIRFGGPKWRFHAALGFGMWYPISDAYEIHQRPVNLGLGVSYSFGGISNK
ncbi:MAG: hypothetical protein LBU91_06500 [Bacteroidales bacterium]|jgi:hypothetical protein|nr:hypothetical protein [Bacteroidales bacterium]